MIMPSLLQVESVFYASLVHCIVKILHSKKYASKKSILQYQLSIIITL